MQDVTYMLDGKGVGGGTASGEYFNTSTYNNSTKREIRIEITNETTPKELYFSHMIMLSANWGYPKIVVVGLHGLEISKTLFQMER